MDDKLFQRVQMVQRKYGMPTQALNSSLIQGILILFGQYPGQSMENASLPEVMMVQYIFGMLLQEALYLSIEVIRRSCERLPGPMMGCASSQEAETQQLRYG